MSRLRRGGQLAALGAAAWLGHAVWPDAAAPRATPAACVGQAPSIDQAMVRGAVRAELANLAPSAAATPPVRGADPATPPPAVPVEPGAPPRALDDGRRLIGEALARRRWDAQDAAAMRQLLGSVDGDARAELLAQLIPAFNDGRLALATGGAPF